MRENDIIHFFCGRVLGGENEALGPMEALGSAAQSNRSVSATPPLSQRTLIVIHPPRFQSK